MTKKKYPTTNSKRIGISIEEFFTKVSNKLIGGAFFIFAFVEEKIEWIEVHFRLGPVFKINKLEMKKIVSRVCFIKLLGLEMSIEKGYVRYNFFSRNKELLEISYPIYLILKHSNLDEIVEKLAGLRIEYEYDEKNYALFWEYNGVNYSINCNIFKIAK